VLSSAVVIGALVLFFLLDFAMSAGRVHPGVTVGGVKVGGMKPDRAATTLALQLPEKSKEPVVVTYEDKEWSITPADLELSFDYNALTSQAMSVGRAGGLFASMGQRVGAWFGSAKLAARATAAPDKLAATIADIAAETDTQPQDAKVKLDGTTAAVTGAEAGKLVNRPQLTTSILTAFTSENRQIAAPVAVAQADISDAEAEAAKSVAEGMISEPATVTWGTKKKWSLAPDELSKMIAFRKVENTAAAAWTLEAYVSEKKAAKVVEPKLGGKIGHPARDARFRTRSGKVAIVPSKTGIGPDFETLSANLSTVLKTTSGQPRIVALRTHKTEPKLTTAMARAMNIKERISTYTTLYVASNRPRVNNIHLLGDSLDGQLIKPGGTFSFNGAIGERTAAKGYVEAPAIVQGKLVPQLGGGICQVGTTLFNSVFVSGMPVLERHNHSFYISHYPTGRDATVSWGGPDLKFKNDTDGWMLISVSYTSGSITISLYGTDPHYKVTSKTSPFTNEKPFSTEKIKDPKLEEGKKVIEDPGVKGMTCTVTRTVKKGGKTVRTDTFKSVYRPKTEVVRVGTKAVKSKETTDKAGPKKN
jgi:vancomycin resistance protein YoaR